MQESKRGFTLVEMMVVAPIVILLIGAFIALIINLTGEVMSSRGSNVLTYNLQDALNQIEEDVKLSSTYLSRTNIDLTSTKQGYGGTSTTGSTTPFTNIQKSGGSSASLILNGLVTNGNPMSNLTGYIYLANSPNPCTSAGEYSNNRPMSMNIVYYVDNKNTLWRRVIMPSNYATPSVRCGTAAPWQQPSCTPGYDTTSLPFCKTNDVRLIDGVAPSDFVIQYFSSASSTSADTTTNNPTITDDAVRATALQATPTVAVTITAKQTVAGRDIVRSGTVRATRLDTNASSIAIDAPPTAVPAVPTVTSTVYYGHNVTFTWPRVATATSYDLEWRVNGGAWQADAQATNIDNNSRSYTVTAGGHQDTVEARVRSANVLGDSAWGSNSLTIPLWAPLISKNGWTDYDQEYATAAYTKTKAGVVMLKGLVKGGTGDIGVLPPDYAPQKNIMFATSSNQAVGRLDVRPDGTVDAEVANSAWFSLDGTAFMPSDTTFTNFTYQNGWTTWDPANWNPASYAVDGVGRVHLRGLMQGGTVTAGTTIFSVPTAILAPEYTHWVQIVNNSAGHLSSVPSNSSVIAKNGATTSFNSVSAMYYTSARTTGTTCTTQWCNMSLQNGWVHYGAPFSTPQYTKGSDGIVNLKGLIKSGTAAAITTLPSGYCPKQRLLMTVITADAWGRVDMVPQSNGTCILTGSSYSTTWLSLDSFKYIADQ